MTTRARCMVCIAQHKTKICQPLSQGKDKMAVKSTEYKHMKFSLFCCALPTDHSVFYLPFNVILSKLKFKI